MHFSDPASALTLDVDALFGPDPPISPKILERNGAMLQSCNGAPPGVGVENQWGNAVTGRCSGKMDPKPRELEASREKEMVGGGEGEGEDEEEEEDEGEGEGLEESIIVISIIILIISIIITTIDHRHHHHHPHH